VALTLLALPVDPLTQADLLLAQAISPRLKSVAEAVILTVRYCQQDSSRALGVPYPLRRSLGVNDLDAWPITGLVAATLNGVDILPACTFDYWTVRFLPSILHQLPSATDEIILTLKLGWNDGETPADLLVAAQLMYDQLTQTASMPVGISEERYKEQLIRYDTSVAQNRHAFPPTVAATIARYHPGFAVSA
jgi:hypothetical protein